MSTDTLIFFDQYCGRIYIKDALNLLIHSEGITYSKEVDFSPREFSTEEFERILHQNLDNDSLRKIEEIRDDLNKLYYSNQLVYVLPILKKVLDEYADKIVFNKYKPIIITENNRILISQFDDMEVEFSHMTQAVYIFFCQNPNGINIKELSQYREELLVLYSKISNFSDFDLVVNNIKELVLPNKKAIYTHISRIKATFYKIMDAKYAENYIITSESFGSDYKYIPILKNN